MPVETSYRERLVAWLRKTAERRGVKDIDACVASIEIPEDATDRDLSRPSAAQSFLVQIDAFLEQEAAAP